MRSYFDQAPYEVRMDWGPRAAREAAARGDIIVIVDVLSFSTTVTTGLHYGAVLFPMGQRAASDDGDAERRAQAFAASAGAELTVGRAESLRTGKRSLSPLGFSQADAGKRFVLRSLNGALCTESASSARAVWVGCLLNAASVARAAKRMQERIGAPVTVTACGEVWDGWTADEQKLRPGVEDYLGAGAIIAELGGSRSPEADICAGAFAAARSRIPELLFGCGSGRELAERGFAGDVRHAAQLNVFETAPLLQDGRFVDGAASE